MFDSVGVQMRQGLPAASAPGAMQTPLIRHPLQVLTQVSEAASQEEFAPH